MNFKIGQFQCRVIGVKRSKQGNQLVLPQSIKILASGLCKTPVELNLINAY